jgi:phosphatidylglycerol:prolipoprotein diacylglycerol transferase
MHPVLFHIGSFPIHAYGFMLALSFLLGIWLSRFRARQRGLDPDVITDLGFYLILAAVIGARAYYVILHFEEFRANPMDIINPFQEGNFGIGGLVMYGGFIGAVLAGTLYFLLKKDVDNRRLLFLQYADVIAPSIGFGIFLTRIGCFLNGCCHGAEHTGFPTVVFPLDSPAGVYQHQIHAAGLHPAQLYLAIGGLLIACLILALERKTFFTGFSFYMVVTLKALLRFSVDFTRYYEPDEMFGGLSHNQILCIILFVVFAGLIVWNSLHPRASVPTETDASLGDHGSRQ